MGTRKIIACCKDCEKADRCGEFPIVFEWLDKKELIKHIEDTHCPDCGSDDWHLTDESEI